MLHRRIGLTALMAGTVVLAACSDSSPTSPTDGPQQPITPAAPTAERLVIEPGSILLPGGGSSVELRAVAYDAAGAEVAVESITWTSLAPEVVTVSADGLATAVGPLGSTSLVARAGTLESEPVQALVAVPADDAVLVADASFTGTPEAEDPDAVYGLGWRYRVPVAADVVVEPGQIMLASGEMPVGGRVVGVAPGAGGNIVTLELVSLDEMFDDLVFEQRIDLRDPELFIPEDVEQGFDVLRLPDGGVRFEGRPARDGWGEHSILGDAARAAEFPLGPFTCKLEGGLAVPSLPVGPTFRLLPSFDYEVAYHSETGGLQRMIIEGDLEVEAEAGAVLEATTGGKVSCSRRLGSIRIPFPGPLGLFFGGRIDLKAGFAAEGSLTLAEVGFKVEGAAHAEGRLGVACAAGCGVVREFDVGLVEDSFDAELTGSLLGGTEPFHVNLKASVFGKAVLRIGHPYINMLQAELVEFSAGPAQKFDLATPLAQAEDEQYRSTFGAVLTLSAGPAADVEDAMQRFRLSIVDPSVDVEFPLSASPRGTFSITPDRVAPGNTSMLGETATFTVALDPTTYLGGYAVEAVHIMWLREDEHGELELNVGRPGCTTIPASPGQTVFTCTAQFTEDHMGEQTFVAFVEAKLFGVPFPLFLEVANDGRETVVVGSAPVTVEDAFAYYHIEADAESRRPDTVRDTTSFAADPLFLPLEYRLRNEYEPDGDLGPDEQEDWTAEVRVDALLSHEVNETASGLILGAMIEGETRASVESFCANPYQGTGTCGIRSSVDFSVHSKVTIQVHRPVDLVATLQGGPVDFTMLWIWDTDNGSSGWGAGGGGTGSLVFSLQDWQLGAGEVLSGEGTLEPGRYEIFTHSHATPDSVWGLLACDYRLNGTLPPGCTSPVPAVTMQVVNNIQLLLAAQEPES